MTIGWIIFGIVAVATTVLGAFVYTKKRDTIRASIGRGLKRGRRKLFRKNVSRSKTAIKARSKRKLSTPRGKIKAKRKAQPPGLLVPHVRRPDDPRVTTKLARKAKARVVVARAMHKQRKSERNIHRPAILAYAIDPNAAKAHARHSNPCNHTTKRGTKCQHPVLNGTCAAGHTSGRVA